MSSSTVDDDTVGGLIPNQRVMPSFEDPTTVIVSWPISHETWKSRGKLDDGDDYLYYFGLLLSALRRRNTRRSHESWRVSRLAR